MFCQDVTSKVKISSVTTMHKSDRILEAAKYDERFSVDLAGVSDLIAVEGKYHNPYYQHFLRMTSKTSESAQTTDLAIKWLIDELTTAARKAHVFQLCEVWQRYCDLAENANIGIRQSYISRRCTFKVNLEQRLHKVQCMN